MLWPAAQRSVHVRADVHQHRVSGNISAGIGAAGLTDWGGPDVCRSPMMRPATTNTASAPAQ
jgi:hypothetical protein